MNRRSFLRSVVYLGCSLGLPVSVMGQESGTTLTIEDLRRAKNMLDEQDCLTRWAIEGSRRIACEIDQQIMESMNG